MKMVTVTRAEILISQSQVKVEFATSRDCRVIKGSWIGRLTGALLSDASDVDIDHIIPLSYAHRHGGFSWSPSKKKQFANDPINLIPAYDVENRKKSDKGPSEYLPSDKKLACAYIKKWEMIRIKYDLNIAPDDKVIIRDMMSNLYGALLLMKLPSHLNSVKGFLDHDEGICLYNHALSSSKKGPILEMDRIVVNQQFILLPLRNIIVLFIL